MRQIQLYPLSRSLFPRPVITVFNLDKVLDQWCIQLDLYVAFVWSKQPGIKQFNRFKVINFHYGIGGRDNDKTQNCCNIDITICHFSGISSIHSLIDFLFICRSIFYRSIIFAESTADNSVNRVVFSTSGISIKICVLFHLLLSNILNHRYICYKVDSCEDMCKNSM